MSGQHCHHLHAHVYKRGRSPPSVGRRTRCLLAVLSETVRSALSPLSMLQAACFPSVDSFQLSIAHMSSLSWVYPHNAAVAYAFAGSTSSIASSMVLVRFCSYRQSHELIAGSLEWSGSSSTAAAVHVPFLRCSIACFTSPFHSLLKGLCIDCRLTRVPGQLQQLYTSFCSTAALHASLWASAPADKAMCAVQALWPCWGQARQWQHRSLLS